MISNDFAPGLGGIETFVTSLADGLRGRVVVLTRRRGDDAALDRQLGCEVIRLNVGTLLPTAQTAQVARTLLRERGLDRVVFGAAAPLGLLAQPLREAGARRLIAISHGHEVWWAKTPGTRAALRRIGDQVDHLTYISEFTRGIIAPALSPGAARAMSRLSPPVDVDAFRPRSDPASDGDLPVVGHLTSGAPGPVCLTAGRLVRQKGITRLLRSWRQVCDQWPHDQPPPLLRIAGGGPEASLIRRRARGLPVQFVGALRHGQMPEFLASGDLFAAPFQTRLAGLNPEGFGLVAAEAAASGLPLVVGNSGGAAETVLDGVSGEVLNSRDVGVWAQRISRLLRDPERSRAMGAAGRAHVLRHFTRADMLARAEDLLSGRPLG